MERPNVQVLSTVLPLFWHGTDTRLRTVAARHIGAVRRAVDSLREYYEKDLAAIESMSMNGQTDPRYPYPCDYTDVADSTKRSFKYVSHAIEEKLIFFGKTEGNE